MGTAKASSKLLVWALAAYVMDPASPPKRSTGVRNEYQVRNLRASRESCYTVRFFLLFSFFEIQWAWDLVFCFEILFHFFALPACKPPNSDTLRPRWTAIGSHRTNICASNLQKPYLPHLIRGQYVSSSGVRSLLLARQLPRVPRCDSVIRILNPFHDGPRKSVSPNPNMKLPFVIERQMSRSLPALTDTLGDSLNDRLLFAVPKSESL